MAVERTLSIIKPDATRRNLTGKINARFEEAGLRIVAQKRIRLTKEQAEKFYEVHAERAFFGEAWVGYIPGERILGISKLVRLVQAHQPGGAMGHTATEAAGQSPNH